MSACLICRTEATERREVYFCCPNCGCWWQDPAPPKTFIAEFEGDPAVMSEGDRQVNRELADRLFRNVMGGNPGKTLDIGCKLPILASALGDLGCRPHACDAAELKYAYMGVQMHRTDIEDDDQWKYLASFGKFDLITLIHVLEHLLDPLAVFRKLRQVISDNGALFLRLPDHDVNGWERDMTPGHFQIHNYFFCARSILQCCVETGAFVMADSWALDGVGQRDIVLKPI
jgi:SAM-dependent methyltransferase